MAYLQSGRIRVDDLGPSSIGEGVTDVTRQIGAYPGITSATTIINSQGPFFSSLYQTTVGGQTFTGGTPQNQALILLHEVGHAMGLLLDDANSATALSGNNKAVLSHCGNTINCCASN